MSARKEDMYRLAIVCLAVTTLVFGGYFFSAHQQSSSRLERFVRCEGWVKHYYPEHFYKMKSVPLEKFDGKLECSFPDETNPFIVPLKKTQLDENAEVFHPGPFLYR